MPDGKHNEFKRSGHHIHYELRKLNHSANNSTVIIWVTMTHIMTLIDASALLSLRLLTKHDGTNAVILGWSSFISSYLTECKKI